MQNSACPFPAPAYVQRTCHANLSGFSALPVATFIYSHPMPTSCHIAGCKSSAPHALEEQKLCVLHYTLSLEASCSEMRRETALGNAPHERQREIMRFITESGEKLARVATSGMPLTDDLKARILSTFLTLMNLRENLDRASMRTPPGRSGAIR
jgi:hypothetical protein